jgi:hypothetical protein
MLVWLLRQLEATKCIVHSIVRSGFKLCRFLVDCYLARTAAYYLVHILGSCALPQHYRF